MTWAEAILRTTRALDRLRTGEVDLEQADLTNFGPELGPLPPSLADEARRCLQEILAFEAQLQTRLDQSRTELAMASRRPMAATAPRGPAFVDVHS